MKTISKVLMITLLTVSAFSAYAAPDAAIQADNTAIDSACATDAKTAGCGTEVVGKGLLICLHKYKKANPTYKFTDSCKAALKQRHADKEAGK